MSWFKHNGNASFDSRMVALQEALGYFGIGVYWTMVERIECWGDGVYPRKRLIDELCGKRTTRSRLTQVLDQFNLFVTLPSGMVMLQRNPKQTTLPNTSDVLALEDSPKQSQSKDISSESQRARVYKKEEDKTKNKTTEAGTPTPQGNVQCSMFNVQSETPVSNSLSRYAAEMAADRGEWHEMVCMKSGYSTLLHKYWEQAVTQWRQHVISYSTDSDVYSLQRARYYFNSFIKLSTKSGQDLKAFLEVLEARATQSATEAEALPPNAPPRPSPNAVWNPAKEEWSEFYSIEH